MRLNPFFIMQPAIKVFSDRARESALRVRRHQSALGASNPPTSGMANPKIQARVKEILAAKQKGKAKGAKGKGGKGKAAKPKDSRTPQEKANQNRAQVAKQTGLGDLEGTLVRVAAGMAKGGKDLEPEAHDKLVEKGLAKRHADGSVTLSPAGRKWKSAADKGDADGANAALNDARASAADSAAKEKAKSEAKQEREKVKAAKVSERAAKQKKQQQAQKQKAQARAKIKAEREKARAAKEKAKAEALAKAKPDTQPEKQEAGKAMNIDELAIKAGARHSRNDQQHIQAIHDSAVACGADCGMDDDEDMPDDDEEEGVKAIKGIMDNPLYYAQHECSDIMQAANALSTMAMLIQSELMEEDEDDAHISMLCDGARTLVKFISAELDELEGAAGDAADDARMGPMKALYVNDPEFYRGGGLTIKGIDHAPVTISNNSTGEWIRFASINGEWQVDASHDSVKARWDDISAKAIAAREDVNPKAGVSEYGNVTFADAKNKKYPIDTADHIRAAWNYIAKEANAAKYDPDEVAQIKAKIVAAWKKLIDKAGPPSAGKAVELDEQFFAVKAIGDDGIMGPGVRYGSPDEPDISEHRDYFTKSTNYYLDAWDKRPMLWHHAVPQTDLIDALKRAGADQEEIKAMREAIIYLDQNPVIGTWTKAVADPAAVWMNGVLDRAHRYRAAIKRMVDLGMLKISTDSIPQMVRREKQSNGTNEVKCWPIVAASLTPQAAEPRLFDVQAIKSIYETAGLEFPFTFDDEPETKADDDRARALLFELELLELELSATL